jgi:CheY-like chemotaxis protein/anti-sigma regulatory factor (Ser/Thr protein kinase)
MAWLEAALLGAAALSAAAGYAAGRRRLEAEAAAAPVPAALRLAEVTHELRTPVAGMIGMAALLGETGLTPEQAAYAEAIGAAGRALLGVVDDLLDSAANAAGAAPVRPFAPQRLVEEVAELLAPRALAKGIEIAAFVAPDVPARLVGDGGRIRQLLLNLAGNAVKFTAEGGVGLRVEAAASGIAFSVHDTGPGLPAPLRTGRFGRFRRGGAAESESGLGLAIAQRLAERLGGRLAVTSAPGRGTTISATLPLAAAKGTALPAAAPPLAGLGVVVAARSPFAAPWLVERLVAEGAAATLAGDAATARARLAETAGAVLVADRALGPDIVRLAAQARAQGRRTVALTTPAERRDLDRLHAEGFDHFLVKPVRAGSLLALLRPLAMAGRGEGPPPAPGAAGRALLAEDDPVNALLAEARLKRMGYAVERVGDGLAAVAAFRDARSRGAPFALVLLDLGLPGLDGCAVAQRIRAIEKGDSSTPVRLVGVSAAEESIRARAAGMDAFLRKPLDGAALATAV